MQNKLSAKHTAWSHHSDWYTETISDDNSFHQKVILPNLLRLMNISQADTILDIGCGDGFFDEAFAHAGAKHIMGIDAAEDLVASARNKRIPRASFALGDARNLSPIPTASADKITAILSLQNIDTIDAVVQESSRILKKNGSMYWVINHPCFRIPQSTHWEWNEEKSMQFRRVDRYLSEQRISIDMHPGATNKQHTLSFHRPLQWYMKTLAKHGFAIAKMEEWISHKPGPKGKTFEALETSRKEIPLFLCLEIVLINRL